MSWLGQWFGYGLGAGAARSIFAEPKPVKDEPVRQQTEAEIRADEQRYDKEAKRLAAEDAAAKS